MISIFILFAIAYLYFAWDYATGMSVYATNNNKNIEESESCWKTIELEWDEFVHAIKYESWFDIVMEFYDVLHSYLKYVIVSTMPSSIYCSWYCWFIVFPLILPCGIKLANRYRKIGCIRNHKGEKMNHKCIHRPDFIYKQE